MKKHPAEHNPDHSGLESKAHATAQQTLGVLLDHYADSLCTAKTPFAGQASNEALWPLLAEQLEKDATFEPTSWDDPLISSYLDGEWDAFMPPDEVAEAREAFEIALSRQPKLAARLQGMDLAAHAVRRLGYRLEDNCTFDCSDTVLAAYAEMENTPAEQLLEALGTQLDPATIEQASAFVDKALSEKEAREFVRLQEADGAVQSLTADFSQLSHALGEFAERLEAQAPDLWNNIAAELRENPTPANVVQFAPQQLSKRISPPGSPSPVLSKSADEESLKRILPLHRWKEPLRWSGIGAVAAAVILAVVAFPSLWNNALLNGGESPEVATVQEAALQGARSEIASSAIPSAEEYLMLQTRQSLPDSEVAVILGEYDQQ